jgi:Uma2 family endonuclease
MKLAEVGILHEDDPVELLDGELITMSPIGYQHAATVNWLSEWLHESLRRRAIVHTQATLPLNEHDAPEPDLAVLRPQSDYYRSAHPAPADIHWIIEVADTSLAYDAGAKKCAYAAAGIAEYWIIDLGTPALLVFRDPQHGEYHSQQSIPEAQSISPLAFPDISTTLRHILGRH